MIAELTRAGPKVGSREAQNAAGSAVSDKMTSGGNARGVTPPKETPHGSTLLVVESVRHGGLDTKHTCAQHITCSIVELRGFQVSECVCVGGGCRWTCLTIEYLQPRLRPAISLSGLRRIGDELVKLSKELKFLFRLSE